jgi:tetraacyldisaccharide 4'-kinase
MASGYLERVILGDQRGPIGWLILALLWPLSLIYRIGLAVYLWVYNVGLRKRCKLAVPVISVGNLTFGGTGKTPAVQELCRILTGRGQKVVVLSRGYGGSARTPMVVSDGKRVLADSLQAGDEPVLLAQTLDNVAVVVGKDRRASGKLAQKLFNPDVIVLDDGMQYWQLHRNLDIVVLDAARPFGSGFVMPMGDLREPVSGLRRAGIVLLSGISNATDKTLIPRIAQLAPKAHVCGCMREPVCFINAADGQSLDLDWIKGRKVLAFCGIGSPWPFIEMLESLRASVEASIVFSDHYRLTVRDIKHIIDEAEAHGVEAVITTEKDVARMIEPKLIPNLHALSIRLHIEDTTLLAKHIAKRVNG